MYAVSEFPDSEHGREASHLNLAQIVSHTNVGATTSAPRGSIAPTVGNISQNRG